MAPCFQGFISTGTAYDRFCVSNFVIFCFQECWSNFLFDIQLKRRFMKTANQEFITFDKPII